MKRKLYEPVREFERQTSYCPLYLAWRIVDEARNYFRTPIPEAYAGKLARRAEAVFALQPFWRRKAMRMRGYGYILSFMRHWLAGVLAKENPVLFRQLPECFKLGLPFPEKPLGGAAAPPYQKPKMVGLTCRSATITRGLRGRSPRRPARRFVHGCELLPL